MLSIVVPCFNEEASLPIFFEETEKVKKHLNMPFEYIFVNDGSSDQTLSVLRDLYHAHPKSVAIYLFEKLWQRSCSLCGATSC